MHQGTHSAQLGPLFSDPGSESVGGRGVKGVSITPKNDFAGAVFITKEDSRILFVMPSGVKSESARQIPLHSRVNTGMQIIKPIGKIAHVVLGS